jgi:mannose/fructose/N-acetylgalactosamine-specific phosphotransferase system component IID
MDQRHSGLGIASFALSMVMAVFIFLLLVVAGVMESSRPGGIDETSAGAIILGLLIIGSMFAELVALGLGVGGLMQKDRNKLFPILGAVFSAMTLLGVTALMILGSLTQ